MVTKRHLIKHSRSKYLEWKICTKLKHDRSKYLVGINCTKDKTGLAQLFSMVKLYQRQNRVGLYI